MDSASRTAILSLDPNYTCRFKARYHPRSEDAMPTARDYIVQRWPWKSEKRKQLYILNNIEEATCLSFPTILDDRLETTIIWFSYTLMIDDLVENMSMEEATAFCSRFSSAVLGKRDLNLNDPHDSIIAEMRARFLTSADEDDRKHGIDVLEETCKWLCGASNLDERLRSMRSFESFIEWREIDVGVGFFLALLRWSCGIYLPNHMVTDANIIQLFRTAGRHVTLANDLYSYRSEMLGKQNLSGSNPGLVYNAIPVLSTEKGLDAQTAMNELKHLLSSLEDQSEATAKILQAVYLDDDGVIIEKCIRACEAMMAGNCKWSTFCMRYNAI